MVWLKFLLCLIIILFAGTKLARYGDVIAEKTGYLLGTHKEQNKVYDDPHHLARGKWLYDPTFYNDKDLCNCPLFLDAKLYERPLKRSWEIFSETWI